MQQQNQVLQSQVSKLQRENGKLGSLTANLRSALTALPFDSGLPTFTRQLSSQAQQNNIALTSIVVGSITSTTDKGSGASGTGTTGTSATDNAAGKTFAIPVTLISTGSLAHQLAFLKAIQVTGPRRALVNSTQLAPAADTKSTSVDASCTMTTQLTVFTAPLTPQQLAQLNKLLSGDVSN